MLGTWLIGFGLALDIAGACLMFRFGVPAYPQRARAGQSHLLLEEDDPEEKQRVERADRIAKLGIVLLVAGFAFQFVGLLL
jgi:hypothetical protein